MSRRRPFSLIAIAAALLATGCAASRVPPTPPAAQGQVPHSGPLAPWQGRGRLEISYPGTQLSVDAFVRGLGERGVRLVLVNDGGVQLADVTAAPTGVVIQQSVADLRERLPALARLVAQAYGPVAEQGHEWSEDRLLVHAGDERRWYGGDPLLLRLVEGGGDNLLINDYRPLGSSVELLAREVLAESTFVTVRLRLASASAGSAPPAQPAAH